MSKRKRRTKQEQIVVVDGTKVSKTSTTSTPSKPNPKNTAAHHHHVLQQAIAELERDVFKIQCVPCTYESHHSKTAHHGNCSNPNCLYGLGEKTTGIWDDKDNEKFLKAKLGSSPKEQERKMNEQGQRTPVGLVNLGATCYVNSLLQVLFFDTAFRTKLFEWENPITATPQITDNVVSLVDSSSASTDSSTSTSSSSASSSSSSSSVSPSSSTPTHSVGVKIAHELRSLFGHLQEGYGSSFNPRKLITILQIPTGVQQDAQEFNKLLLSKLEDTFRASSSSTLHNFIPSRYGGEMSHCTKCLKCKNISRRKETFYELSLQIRTGKWLWWGALPWCSDAVSHSFFVFYWFVSV